MCVRPQLSRALNYFIVLLCHNIQEHRLRSGSYRRFAGSIVADSVVSQASLALCCLDGEKVVGSDDNSIVISSDI